MGTLFSVTLILNLSLGATGPQVMALQQMLNRDVDTRIATVGSGSPGQETSYFGSLTKSAVIRFQEKYTSEVLAPAGLVKGSGYVGSYTRAKLNAFSVVAKNVPTQEAPARQTAATTTETIPQNPNLKNINAFLAAIDTVGTKQGVTADTLATIKDRVVKDAATTTDLQSTFANLVQGTSHQSNADTSFAKTVAVIEKTFAVLFAPEKARASVGIPFGGPLEYAYFCNCSATWLITLGPLPPTYVSLLSYVPGSQAYLSYNIPATQWLLGEYAGGGACLIIVPHGCFPLPSEGTITPTVGSSL